MVPAEGFTPQQLVGKRVAFKDDADHAACWHGQVGLKSGVVVKIGQTMAQKAQSMGAEIELPKELLAQGEESPRVWVKVDANSLFPRGCEAAVEMACLLVLEP
jgi:hypothetical protein